MGYIEEEERRIAALEDEANSARHIDTASALLEEQRKQELKAEHDQLVRQSNIHLWHSSIPKLTSRVRKIVSFRGSYFRDEMYEFDSDGKLIKSTDLTLPVPTDTCKRVLPMLTQPHNVVKVMSWDKEETTDSEIISTTFMMGVEVSPEGVMTFHGRNTFSLTREDWLENPASQEEAFGNMFRDPIKEVHTRPIPAESNIGWNG